MNRQVRYSRLLAGALLLAPAALVPGCGDDDGGGGGTPDIDAGIDGGADGGQPGDGGADARTPPDSSLPPVGDVWAYTSTNKLLKLERASGRVERSIDAQVPASETVWGLDVRPADGKVYAITSSSSVYTVDPATGAFGDKKLLVAAAGDDDPFTTLSGAAFGVDFNPIADRLRVVSNTGQNLRIDVRDGTVVTDAAITPATPGITSVAYTNNWAQNTPCGTSLYAIDAAGSKLLLQSPPNAGVVTELGTLTGVAGAGIRAFDIATTARGENVALIAAADGGDEAIYQLDLVSAKATLLSKVSGHGQLVALLGTPLAARPDDKVGELIATTRGNRVVSFERGSPATFCTDLPITGLAAGESIVGADVRPADGRLYVVTRAGESETNGKIARLDVLTGVLGAALPLTKDGTDAYAGLSGTEYGVDFDPAADRLRVISSSGQNLRIDPVTGKVQSDTTITPQPLVITEVAYANPSGATQPASSTATTLWAIDTIDTSDDRLGRIGADPAGDTPNAGVFQAPVALGVDALPLNGADIEPVSGLALAALSVGDNPTAAESNTTLYRLSPTATPVAAALGKIGASGEPLTSLSFAPKP